MLGAGDLLRVAIVLAGSLLPAGVCQSQFFSPDLDGEAAKALQKKLRLPVRVVDAGGEPVVGARVTPWAIRSSQGHGQWADNPKDPAGFGPRSVVTDEQGAATVVYPRFRDKEEQTRTLAISLNVDQPGFAYRSDLHIDVPLGGNRPFEIVLERGVTVEARPLVDGEPTDLEDVYAFWSDGRSWRPGHEPEKLAGGVLRVPAMPPGGASLLLAKLDDERVTHFSRVVDFELNAGGPFEIDVPMTAAMRIEGRLGENVPRPVENGRIKVRTLRPADKDYTRTGWFSWAPVRPDGAFTIDGWPAGEAMQLIAICDGYLAASGDAPPEVKNPRDPATDPFCRPQVFRPEEGEAIEVAMTPLAPCEVTAVDQDGRPLAGLRVVSCPNVGWWNGGSQIYCHPLVRCEDLLQKRSYQDAVDNETPGPFQGKTDADGRVTLHLPVGKERLYAGDDFYELPAFLGRRDVKIELKPGEATEVTLRLQPTGGEKLGEWDKLAGVVFGCSTREGRRICALPGVREQMDEFAKRFRDAKNQRDPKLLSEAYAAVAEAFFDAGDPEEASKWLTKSMKQAERAKRVE